jgi:hypothetical protein
MTLPVLQRTQNADLEGQQHGLGDTGGVASGRFNHCLDALGAANVQFMSEVRADRLEREHAWQIWRKTPLSISPAEQLLSRVSGGEQKARSIPISKPWAGDRHVRQINLPGWEFSNISGDRLIYLMSRGVTEVEAVAMGASGRRAKSAARPGNP